MRTPMNEMGVVALFAQYCQSLGYIIMQIQSAFPDATIYRVSTGDLVRTEFEFKAKNFLVHGHNVTGCDLIVCWENNWDDCPLPVIEMVQYHDGAEPLEVLEDLTKNVKNKNQELANTKLELEKLKEESISELYTLKKNMQSSRNSLLMDGNALKVTDGDYTIFAVKHCKKCGQYLLPIVMFHGLPHIISADRFFVMSKATFRCECGWINSFDTDNYKKQMGIKRGPLDKIPVSP